MGTKRLKGDLLKKSTEIKTELELCEGTLAKVTKNVKSVTILNRMYDSVNSLKKDIFAKYYEKEVEEDGFEDRIFGYTLECLINTISVIVDCIEELKAEASEDISSDTGITNQIENILNRIRAIAI